jgi:hypothetical protein
MSPDRLSDGMSASGGVVPPLVSMVAVDVRRRTSGFRHGLGIGAALGPASIIEPDRTQQMGTKGDERGRWTGPGSDPPGPPDLLG